MGGATQRLKTAWPCLEGRTYSVTAYGHSTSFTTAKSRVFMTATQNCTSDQSTSSHTAIYLEAI